MGPQRRNTDLISSARAWLPLCDCADACGHWYDTLFVFRGFRASDGTATSILSPPPPNRRPIHGTAPALRREFRRRP
jgi:hypothetical protein